MKLRRWLSWSLLALSGAYLFGIAAFELAEHEPVFGPIPDHAGMASLPPGFLLGAATSAHQVEGGNVLNDWTAFESQPGNIRDGDVSGVAADHWNRVREDIGLLTSMGANAYRLSLEWSRLEPEQGRWDETAWDHYADELKRLRRAGIEPMVTLLHFTLPRWLAEQGGLTADSFP